MHLHLQQNSYDSSIQSAIPTLTVALSVAYLNIKLDGGQFAETLELAQRVIELTDDEPDKAGLISVSPLANAMAIRGTARWAWACRVGGKISTGAFEKASVVSPEFRSGTFWIIYLMAIPNGVLLSDERAQAEVARIASAADHFGEQITIDMAHTAHGITLVHREGSERDVGAQTARRVRMTPVGRSASRSQATCRWSTSMWRVSEPACGDCDGAIELARTVLDHYLRSANSMWLAVTTAILVESLLQRGSEADLTEAREATAKLAAVPTEPGCVLNEIWLLRLRALLAQAEGDEVIYRDHRDRYRKMANELGFEGHMAWAAEMV